MSVTAVADGSTFGLQLYRYLMENSWAFPEGTRIRAAKVGVAFAIDRDGKLLDAEITQSSGLPDVDDGALVGLRRMQSFPRVPDDVPVPYKARTTLNFGPQPRTGHIDLKWPPMSVTTPDQEISFRSELQHHLRLYPRILTEDTKLPHDVHSIIAFTIDRDGKVIDAKITKSFGLKSIDDQTIAWLKSMPPFPKIPPALKAPMGLTAEIVFGPKGYDDEARRTVSGVCRGC